MKNSQDKTQLKSKLLIKVVSVAVTIVIVMLVGYFVASPIALRIIYSDNVPSLPVLNGYSSSLVEYIEEANAKALDKPYSEEAVGNLAMIYHSNFFYAEAEFCYDIAKKINNEEWRWFYYTALIKEELGDTKSAVENFQRVVALNSTVANAWFRIGNSYLKQNMFDEATSAFQNVIEISNSSHSNKSQSLGAFPLVVYAKLNLARVYFKQKEFTKASVELQALIKANPRFGSGYRLYGQLLNTTGKIEEGKEFTIRAGDLESYQPPSDPLFNELILKSRNSDFILKQIDIALKSENYDWAEVLCKYILDYDSTDIEATSKYILVMLFKFESIGLEEKLQTYFEYYLDNNAKLMDMASLLHRWNQNKFAVKFLEQAIKISPNEIDPYLLYLRILAWGDINEKVLELCKDAIKIAPTNSDVRTEYGRILALKGKENDAIKQFELALKYNPKNETTLVFLGIIAQEKGNVESAIMYYRRSVSANPLNVKTVLRLGNYLLELKKWNESIKLFENALKTSPNNIDLLERLAWVKSTCPNSKIRNGNEALELGKRIALISKLSASQDIRCGITLAVSYAEIGDYDRAINILKNMIVRANETNTQNYIPNIEGLIRLFGTKTPYRL